MNTEKLAESYVEMGKSFEAIRDSLMRIVKNNDGFHGLHCAGEDLQGFGKTISFSWRFVIHKGDGYGVFVATCEENPFFEIYFRRDIPVFMRTLNQQTGDFYGNQLPDQEKLLAEIVESFLGQECFKP